MTNDLKWIYESPNGGKTVTRRLMNASLSTKELVYETPEHLEEKRFHEQWHKFKSILQAAKNNSVLEKMLHEIEVYYELSK